MGRRSCGCEFVAEIAAQNRKNSLNTSKSSESSEKGVKKISIQGKIFVGRVFLTLVKWGCEVYGSTKQKEQDFYGCYWPKKNPERENKFSEVFEEFSFFYERRGKNFCCLSKIAHNKLF